MSDTLEKKAQKVHVAEVVHHGDKLMVPEGMNLDDAIKLLDARKKYLQTAMEVQATFDVFPWDGAYALREVLVQMYGWSPAVAVPGFFGDVPPKLISIETGYKQKANVPWGRFQLPNLKQGYVETDTSYNSEGRMIFALHANILRQDESIVQKLFDAVTVYLASNSIYNGKAIKLRFKENDGSVISMPKPQFMDTAIDEKLLIFSKDVEQAIETNLFVPIRRVDDCKANGIAVKRGVLLGGTFGTGKTLAAKVASKLAVENGVTFIYAPRADELPQAISFAKQYSSKACVVFCEDIDRSIAEQDDGDRTVAMDDLLNTIDGIDSKESNIIVVLTTNNLAGIHQAMLRPGRLDAVIEVTAPDAEAVERLIRAYGAGLLSPLENLKRSGELLAGQIPAVIAEVVKRAKLAQMSLQAPGTPVQQLTGPAIELSALSISRQVELLHPKAHGKSDAEQFQDSMTAVVKRAFNGHLEKIEETHKRVMSQKL